MSNESEEKRPFSYGHLKALMMLTAANAAIMTSEASAVEFDNPEDIEAYPAKRRKELEERIFNLLDNAWEKAT